MKFEYIVFRCFSSIHSLNYLHFPSLTSMRGFGCFEISAKSFVANRVPHGLGANLPAWDKIKLARRAEACKWTVVLQFFMTFGKNYESIFVVVLPLRNSPSWRWLWSDFNIMGLQNRHDTCGQIAREELACWLSY